MNTTLNEHQQKYFLAAFSKYDHCEYSSENKLKLYQFSDVHCKTTNEIYPLHRQSCDEITFIYKGEGTVNHNDRSYPVSAGEIHLCFEGDNHQPISSKNSPMNFYCIGYTLDESNPLHSLSERVKEKLAEGGSAVIKENFGLEGAFRTILNILYAEKYTKTEEHIIVSTLNYIISSVLMAYMNLLDNETAKMTPSESLVLYIISFLRNNAYDAHALNKLSLDTGYSYSYMSHLFTRKMRQNLKSFFLALRMNLAEELLREKSVTEVSSLLGYSSIHSFSKAYKNFHSHSPKTSKSGAEDTD